MPSANKTKLSNIIQRFGSVGLALLCIQLDYWALALALPDMAADLGTTSTDLQWAMSAYMIAVGVAMIPGSRVADLLGRKRLLIVGLIIFGVSSLWIGLSTAVGFVVVGRILQGFGTGLYQPVAWSLVTNATSPTERPRVLGFLSAVGGIGTAAGPLIGGGFASTIGWRWIFLINIPIAVCAIAWGRFQLRESRDTSLRGKSLRNLDWIAALILGIGVSALTLAIDDISLEGISAFTYVPIAVAVLALVGFIARERRATWPLIPPRIWRNRSFRAIVIASTILNMALAVMIFMATVYLQDVYGFSGLIAGVMFIPATIGMAIGGPFGGFATSRIPTQRVLTVGLIGGAIALAGLGLLQNFVAVLLMMGVSTFFLGIGFNFGVIAGQSVVPQEQAGAAAGTLLTIMVTMGGVAVVIASSIFEAVGAGQPTQQATTVTYLCWAAFVGILGVIFGAWQWRGATIAAPRGVKLADMQSPS